MKNKFSKIVATTLFVALAILGGVKANNGKTQLSGFSLSSLFSQAEAELECFEYTSGHGVCCTDGGTTCNGSLAGPFYWGEN